MTTSIELPIPPARRLTTPGLTLFECAALVLQSGFMLIKPLNATNNLFACRLAGRNHRDDYIFENEQESRSKRHAKRRGKGWIILDAFTSSAIVAVHDVLNHENQSKLLTLPYPKAVTVVWKLVK